MKNNSFITKITPLLLFLLFAFAAKAASEDKAIYIYCNDGSMNAFRRTEIEKIVPSHYDLENIYHHEVVSQDYHTPDSVYRIPIATIDSVVFRTPEPVFAKGVVRIDEWIPYLTKVEEDRPALTFSNTLPFTAHKGDVLFYPVWDDERFPDGFAGKITDVIRGEGITFECDSAMIDDIFERLVLFSNIILDESPDENPASRSAKISGEINTSTRLNLDYATEHFELHEKTTIGTNLKLIMRLEPGQPLFAQVSLGGSLGLGLNLGAHFDSGLVQIPDDAGIGKYMTGTFINVPIDQMGLIRFKMRAAPIMKVEGKADFEANLNAKAGFNVNVTYNDGNTAVVPTCNADCSWDAKLNLKGSMFMGVRLYPYITGIANAFTISFKIDAGPRVDGEFYLEEGGDVDVYDSLKDSKVSLFGGATFHVKPQIKVFNWESGKVENIAPFSKDLFVHIKDWYLVPEFSKPEVSYDQASSTISAHSVPSRDLLMPVKVGLGIHDKSGNLIARKYCSQEYKNEKDWNEQALTHEFGNLSNAKYSVHPYVNILGFDVKANPSGDEELCADASHVHAVDLGLSVKWACCNVGASSPEEYGGYYAWGETNEKSEYTEENYQHWVDKDGDGWFNWGEGTISTDIAGTRYDVAHVKWGGSWRMPRLKEIQELVEKCTWQWTIVNGVVGKKITGPNGNSIFLPAAGYRVSTSPDTAGEYGDYWSSTPTDTGACGLEFSSKYNSWDGSYWRCFGFSVRPVSE